MSSMYPFHVLPAASSWSAMVLSVGWGPWDLVDHRWAPGGAGRPGARDDHARDAHDLASDEVLPKHDEAGQGGDPGLEAHHHAEDAGRDAAQGLELERVGDRAREDRDREPLGEQRGVEEVAAAVDQTQRRDKH